MRGKPYEKDKKVNIQFSCILRFWLRNREMQYVKNYRIITICGLSGTIKMTIVIANILYLSLVVELFLQSFYDHIQGSVSYSFLQVHLEIIYRSTI